jgi:hypothetical protein
MEETGIDYMGRMYMDLQGKYRERECEINGWWYTIMK